MKNERWQIKVFLKIHASDRLQWNESTACEKYEVLDDNTIMEKYPNLCYKMHSFNAVFPPKVGMASVAAQISHVEGLFEGHSHTIIILADTKNKSLTSIGINQHHGLYLELFSQLFGQSKSKYHKAPPKLFLSIFSTIKKSNKIVDLLNGQLYTFRTKKDIDGDKMFFQKCLTEERQFLILLKIAQIRHENCCSQEDALVMRLITHTEHEDGSRIEASLHALVINPTDRLCHDILQTVRNIDQSKKTAESDHLGSIADYMESYLLNTRITILQSVINEGNQLLEAIPSFVSLLSLKGKRLLSKQSRIHPVSYSKYSEPRGELQFTGIDTREVTYLRSLFESFKNFCKEAKEKLSEYYRTLQEVYLIRKEFYEWQRFPVSVEIKDNYPKSFFNAKVYTLCENYQMSDLEPLFDRLKILKNRILIALKALLKSRKEDCSNELKQILDILFKAIKFIRGRLQRIFSANFQDYEAIQFNFSLIQPEKIFSNRWVSECLIRLQYHSSISQPHKDNQFHLRRVNVLEKPLTEVSSNLETLKKQIRFQRIHSSLNFEIEGKKELNLEQLIVIPNIQISKTPQNTYASRAKIRAK